METTDYILAWAIYLIAGVLFAFAAWKGGRKILPLEVCCVLLCLLLALMFTPASVEEGLNIKAPALMVFMMDTVMLGAKAGIRAMIPLILALVLALVIGVVLSLLLRLRKARTKSPG